MKITKRQLRRIIKEERRKLTEQSALPKVGQVKTRKEIFPGEAIWYAISTLIDDALDQSDPKSWHELADDLRGLADDVIDSIPEE